MRRWGFHPPLEPGADSRSVPNTAGKSQSRICTRRRLFPFTRSFRKFLKRTGFPEASRSSGVRLSKSQPSMMMERSACFAACMKTRK